MTAIKAKNIILTGFMGTGKSTAGRTLAKRLGWKFIDTDRLIEVEQGRSIPEIFEKEGEDAFRILEQEIAERLASFKQHVIATGGGFIVNAGNLKAARRAGELFLLVASPEQIWHRIGRSKRRPLLMGDDPMARIRALLHERESAYGAVANRILTDGLAPAQVAEEILARLQSQ